MEERGTGLVKKEHIINLIYLFFLFKNSIYRKTRNLEEKRDKTLLYSLITLIYVNKEKLKEIIYNLDPFKQNF